MLSRAVAGTIRGRVVFCIPGSTPAVTLATKTLIVPGDSSHPLPRKQITLFLVFVPEKQIWLQAHNKLAQVGRALLHPLFTDIQQRDSLQYQIPDTILARRHDLFRCDIEKGGKPGGFLLKNMHSSGSPPNCMCTARSLQIPSACRAAADVQVVFAVVEAKRDGRTALPGPGA